MLTIVKSRGMTIWARWATVAVGCWRKLDILPRQVRVQRRPLAFCLSYKSHQLFLEQGFPAAMDHQVPWANDASLRPHSSQNSPTNFHSLAETIVFESYSPFRWETLITGFSSHRSPPSLWTPFYRTSGVPLGKKMKRTGTTRHVLSPESVLQQTNNGCGLQYKPQTPNLGMSNDCTILSADNHLHISCSDCSPSAGTLNLFIRREYTQYHGQLQYAMLLCFLPCLVMDKNLRSCLQLFLAFTRVPGPPESQPRGHALILDILHTVNSHQNLKGLKPRQRCAKHREFEGMIPVITSNHPSNPQQPIQQPYVKRTSKSFRGLWNDRFITQGNHLQQKVGMVWSSCHQARDNWPGSSHVLYWPKKSFPIHFSVQTQVHME